MNAPGAVRRDGMLQTTLIIPTLNRPDDLARCLRSVSKLHRGFDEIIIVDQGDLQTTEKIVGEYDHLNVRIYHLVVRSAAQARNLGIEEAKGTFIFFIDDDTTLDEHYVESAVDYFARHPEVVGVTGYIEDLRGGPYYWRFFKRMVGALLLVTPLHLGIFRSGAAAPLIFLTEKSWFPDVQFLPGGHFACRREVFEAGFRFNSHFILGSFNEDTMFSCQVYKHYGRGSLAYVPEFRLRHYSSPDQSLTSAASIRMHVIHRFIFWRREVYGGSLLNALCYLYSQMGFSIFVFKRFWHTPLLTLRTIAQSYRYLLLHHRAIASESIDYNRFITGA